MSRTVRSALLSLFGVAFVAPVAVAQNLVANPDFDSDVLDWEQLLGTWNYNAGVGNASGPGSADCDPGGVLCQITQCIDVTALAHPRVMTYGGALRNIQSATNMNFFLNSFSNTLCNQGNTNLELVTDTNPPSDPNQWVPFASAVSTLPETQALRIQFSCSGTMRSCGLDDTFLVDGDLVSIFADGFESGSTSQWFDVFP